MKLKSIVIKILAVFFWLAVWQIASTAVGLEIILPSPVTTFLTLLKLAETGEFWLSCGESILRILAGLFVGATVAVLLAMATHSSKIIHALFSPLLTVIKSTPIASFIILALIWIGRETVPSFTTSLIVLPIVWSATHHSIEEVDASLLEMTKVFRFTRTEKLKHLYFPSVFPSFMSAFMTSVGMAWKAGVAAEVLCTPRFSIGTFIFESKKYLETPELFAWTATVIIFSLAIEKLLYRVCSPFISSKRRLSKEEQ